MRIGDAARASGLPVKTVRYYADIGLVAPSGRAGNGYRDYAQSDVQRLGFVRRARAFGFSIDDCRELLGLYSDRDRASADVKRMAESRIEDLDRQMTELAALRADLQRLADACAGDGRPDCPILNGLAGGAARRG
ncbi:Cu(I)-responsive transcriptional regulator [Limibaculum sp. M0105]|uniref:Cu(I)-responsive transcriptional regulator n=1 Tax=Thermohalobaculum xanthum TaxID=2753746 RepID=A0A8J7M6D8_9RHOB|nr:Cu(I)-responsive transcriptional regulator [Thermohalobaculum xanthum]MBK0399401.1 Cu(I)-responsive transcriptional regulator [Thermohalobaculum xanthum]